MFMSVVGCQLSVAIILPRTTDNGLMTGVTKDIPIYPSIAGE